MVAEVGSALWDSAGVRPVVDTVRAVCARTLNGVRALGQSAYRRLIQRIDWIAPQLTDERTMFPEAEQSLHPRRIKVERAPEGVGVGNLGDRDAHLVPLRGRISELERGS